MTGFFSSRWMPIALATALAAGALGIFGASSGGAASNTPSSFLPIVPCRLIDTRPTDQVGPHGTPISADTSITFAVWGTNGECAIPNTAVGIATNVTVVNGTTGSYLTVYPADAPARPKASNLNWVAGSAPTPNQVTVALSGAGAVSVYNFAGTVDVIIDIVGYYVAAQSGATQTTTTTTTTTSTTTTVPALPPAVQGSSVGISLMGACGGCPNYTAIVQIPAGRWLVSYTVVVVNFTGTSDLFRCWLLTNAGGIYGLTTSRVGPGNDVSPHAGQWTLTFASAETVRIACAHDVNIGSGVGLLTNSYMENGVITAIKVAA